MWVAATVRPAEKSLVCLALFKGITPNTSGLPVSSRRPRLSKCSARIPLNTCDERNPSTYASAARLPLLILAWIS